MRKPLFLEGSEMYNYSLYPDDRTVVNHCLPSTIYALEGRELNIYWDSFLRMSTDVFDLGLEYRFDVTCTKGKQEDNRWTYTPTVSDAGSVTWTLDIYYNEVLIKKITCTVVTKALSVGNGVTKNIMMIGDSTTANGYVLAELVNLFKYNRASPASGSTADVMDINTVGSIVTANWDSDGYSRTVNHEGRSGWRLSYYVNNTGVATNVGTSITNYTFDNFTINDTTELGIIYLRLTNSGTTRTLGVYKDATYTTKVASGSRTGDGVITLTAEGGYAITGSATVTYTSNVDASIKLNFFFRNGALNFTKYMSDNSFTLNDNDWVYIHTGINDITGYNTDATLYPVLTTYNSNLLALINNIKAYNANLKIGVLMTIAPCYYQEAFGDNYNNGLTQKRYARNRYLLNESILSYLNSNSFTNVYALPYHINLDTINNFTQELSTPNIRNVSSVMKYNDGLHPTRYGYYQLADVLKSNIKGFES